jgi:hypothetical protein
MSHLFKLVPVGLMLLDEEVLVAGGGGRGASVAGEALVLGPPFVSSCYQSSLVSDLTSILAIISRLLTICHYFLGNLDNVK